MGTALKNISSVRYSSYKDSGIEWVENVPAHWDVKKFKRVFYEIKKRSNPDLNCGSISFGKVVYKDDEKIPESTKKSYQVVKKGDFLVNPLNLNYDLISLRIALSDIDVVVSSGYIVLSNSVKLDKTFYKYFLHRFDVAFMKLLGSGVRQTLNWNDIANCDLIFPPIPEQTAIATFLDRKTALIDQAIDIKQKQIELLKERSQILIHKAVTRGLNPDVKMKDSGVEWIGEIPEHWEVKRLKDIFENIQTGTTPSTTNQKYFDGDIDWYNPKDLNNENLIQAERKLSQLAIDRKEIKMFPKDSILIVGIGGTTGKTSYMLNSGSFNQQITGFHSRANYNKYYFHLLRSISKVMLNTANYTTLPILNNEFFKSLSLIQPNIEEQKEIVLHIEVLGIKFSTAISLKEQEIEKLKEYKATLINSAVTGKIKVYNDAK
jgi:type I restriction enzyme S subunit